MYYTGCLLYSHTSSPPLQCVLHPEECSGRSAEGDWCGQGCSAQCAVQPSPDRCLYTVDCIHSPPSCGHSMASLLSCAPAAQPPALSRRRDNLFFLRRGFRRMNLSNLFSSTRKLNQSKTPRHLSASLIVVSIHSRTSLTLQKNPGS